MSRTSGSWCRRNNAISKRRYGRLTGVDEAVSQEFLLRNMLRVWHGLILAWALHLMTRMLFSPKLYEVLYVSTIASNAPISVVAAIAARSRAWNAEHDITGLLIFDGMRFCQQLEGEQQAVLSLLDRIRLDARHSNVTIFHRGELQARRFRSFSMAFSTLDDADALARLEVLDGDAGISAFSDLLPTLDW